MRRVVNSGVPGYWLRELVGPGRSCIPDAGETGFGSSFVMTFSEKLVRLNEEKSALLSRFERLLAPQSAAQLEAMAGEAAALTRQYFGRTMRLFAPLYLSNECINSCAYCGFSRENSIFRVTLSVDEVVREGEHLVGQGFRHVLLVAGEHPKFVSSGYLERCLRALRDRIPSLGIEVGPMETSDYAALAGAGAETLVVYQETYDRENYAALHTSGPKRDFDWRLECPERGYAGGFRRIGIGALFGLREWRAEALSLAAHLEYLQKRCWKAAFTVAFPRLRPAAGGFVPGHMVSDREFVQMLCAFRLCFPHAGIVMSTREPAALRDAVVPLGVTLMSAGSHTEPGGYTGEGRSDLHLTVKGRRVEIDQHNHAAGGATAQFEISDHRSALQVANSLRARGFDPVWKDWDESLSSAAAASA
ncbi:MAG: 2-iminoacetate synthase ThiH [Verrucomicrobiales bacterium]